MKYIITILFLLNIAFSFSNKMEDNILSKRVSDIEQIIDSNPNSEDLDELKERIINQQNLNEQTLTSISTQLDSASYNMTIFGVLFGVLGVILGIYVTSVERKIVKISEQNKDLLKESKQIKEDVDSVNKLIQSDLFNLFLKIKREETVHILDRLTLIPKDIVNTAESLLSRELQSEDFSKLKLAYRKLRHDDHNFKYSYQIVLFQHFFAEVLKDEEMKNDISKVIDQLIQGTFENDILKTTHDLISVINEVGLLNYKTEINKYFKGLSESQHKDFEDVYKLIFTELKSRQNRFDFYSVIESKPENRIAKIKYGRLLKNVYSDQNSTEGEQAMFKELGEIEKDQMIIEEENRKKEEESKKKQEAAKIK